MTMQIKQLGSDKIIKYEVLVVNGKGIPLVIQDDKGIKYDVTILQGKEAYEQARGR